MKKVYEEFLRVVANKKLSKHSSWWRPLENVFRLRLQKTSWSRPLYSPYSYVFRRCLHLKTSWSRPVYLPWPYVFKTSSRRFQDVLKTPWKKVFKTSSRYLQDVFNTSSEHPQDVLLRRLQDVFNMSCKDVFKTFSRRTIRLNCLPRSRICLGHISEKFMSSAENLQVW